MYLEQSSLTEQFQMLLIKDASCIILFFIPLQFFQCSRIVLDDMTLTTDPKILLTTYNLTKLNDGFRMSLECHFLQRVDDFYVCCSFLYKVLIDSRSKHFQDHVRLYEYIKYNGTLTKLFDRKVQVCQLHKKANRGDFLFVYMSNIVKRYGNFSACPWLPGVYKLGEFLFDSTAIPTYLALPNKNVTLSFSHYKKQKKVKDKLFLDIELRLRYIN